MIVNREIDSPSGQPVQVKHVYDDATGDLMGGTVQAVGMSLHWQDGPRGQRDRVELRQLIGNHDGDDDGDQRDERGHHAQTQTADDDRSGTGLGLLAEIDGG